jgi:hypothetical protein
MAAARGLLPLAQTELLEALVVLRSDSDQAIAQAAQSTLNSQTPQDLLNVVRAPDATPTVLGYLAAQTNFARDLYEAVTTHANTPDTAIVSLASATADGSLLELITLNQQRLIRAPEIIDAVLGNAARTAEAERRVREVRREVFLKERGAQKIAGEVGGAG